MVTVHVSRKSRSEDGVQVRARGLGRPMARRLFLFVAGL